MVNKKLSIRVGLAIAVVVLMMGHATAAPVDAYGGYISDDDINQDDTVIFSGSFHNFGSEAVFVESFNVSFIERLGETSPRDPTRPNISKYYEEERRVVGPNQTLTETITEQVSFDPGSYDVSIFFVFAESSAGSAFNSSYSLVNATLVIQGATQALELARIVFYVIIAVVVGVIGLLVYNKVKKPY